MFDCSSLLRVTAFLLALFATQMSGAQSLPKSRWASCKMPAKAPRTKGLENRHNFQRQLLDLDGNGLCEVMDLWIERLDSSDPPRIGTLDQEFFVFRKGKWEPFVMDMKYFPYTVRARATGRLMLIQAALPYDIGDGLGDMVTDEMGHVFVSPNWRQASSALPPELTLTEIDQGPESAKVLQDLAVLLTRKLATLPADTINSSRIDVERLRIVLLLQLAHQLLPASEWVPMDKEGLLPLIR